MSSNREAFVKKLLAMIVVAMVMALGVAAQGPGEVTFQDLLRSLGAKTALLDKSQERVSQLEARIQELAKALAACQEPPKAEADTR